MDQFNNDFNNYEGQPNHEMNARYGGSNYQSHRNFRDNEEFATEFLTSEIRNTDATSGAVIAGVAGTIASVAALFAYPLILGVIGFALGCFAIAKGNKVLGYIAVATGIFAAIMPWLNNGPFISMF